MRNVTLLLFFLLSSSFVKAQDSLKYRVIFIGDAGEMNTAQRESLKNAAKHVIAGKTTVMYLGDNIYPAGMGLPGSKEEETTRQILQSQFQPMRQMGAAVYFIPGNHDWDKMGPDGLAKIIRQGEYLAEQNDSLLKMIPPNGCPDPTAIQLTDNLTIIAFDSEWWLYPYAKQNPESECSCKTKDDVIARMQELLEANRGKIILFADHHPLQSYGAHGGYFTLKNHIFPLTSLNKNLYIPLPIIGSLYPLLRSSFLSPEDLKHPFYKDMIKKINGVFGAYPNLTYFSGHDHGLQLIKSEQLNLQVLSGGGAKHSANKKGKNSIFQESEQGYVIADLLMNNDMRYDFYVYTERGVKKVYSYTKPFVPVARESGNTVKVITEDSISIKIYPKYDSVSKVHRFFFGENYRKEYALETKVPVIRLSEIKGGLTPLQRGGGFQSHSLRMVDKQGKEWVLRSVEKYPESLLPENLRETFAKDILKDNMSAQHPFSALIVPDIAEAVGVAHANPIIGWISPDANLGKYGRVFENTLCLLEEREPTGKSDNTYKMYKKLARDNDYTYDGPQYLKAKALDILIGDWDRHFDQWRWTLDKSGERDVYQPVPRDRDQVFYLSQGLIPRYAQSSYLLPMIQGYERNVKDVNWFVWESRAMATRLLSQLSEKQWMDIIHTFCTDLTDEVLEKALRKLPEPGYSLRHDQLLAQLKERRAKLPEMMNEYYHFFNKIVDIQASDKGELIEISDAAGGGLTVDIHQLSKNKKVKTQMFVKTFDPKITKEIRLYTHNGNDSLVLNNKSTDIKLRIIGGHGVKAYHVENSYHKVKLYDKIDSAVFTGDAGRFTKILSNDTGNVSYKQTDLYHRSMYLLNGGFNNDDGLSLGFSVKFMNPGFRKFPYGNTQQFSFIHSFSTKAFKFDYRGEWMHTFGKADLILQASAYAPHNTQNFFGAGNETSFDKSIDGISYYRARFSLYQFDPALRWKRPKSSFSVGPSFQYYSYNKDDNTGRFINNSANLHSSDSLTIAKDKLYTGVVVNFINNTRNNEILPSLGSYINLKLQGYTGLNKYANTFGQFLGSVALYKNLDSRSDFVIAERFGGAITVGKQPFYQSAFLGGEGTLLGFRQFRFAGDHSFYNNLEMRVKLADFVSYVLPGQLGLLGFHDIGRVWKKGEESTKWHNGVGGGLYFAPASMTVVRLVAGHSEEGWYPYISLSFRY
ncbi:metallophosphoesterase [Pedobacter sp. UYP1]|uniref:BamA/TamA family outer membrane protein n=1 Tax=Pedobacter sp. UYP1 TaxID=1756396 RepID=UPI003396ACF2